MLSTLKREELLSAIFDKYADSIEVYSNSEFNFYVEDPVFYILCKRDVDFVGLLYKLQEIYELPIHVYCTQRMFSKLLENRKLIWRKSKWYL